MATQYMLTTVDNPFDPFEDYDAWFTWDTSHDYNTAAYLSRVTRTSDELSEADVMSAIERAMNEIILHDPLDIYMMVSKEVDINNQPSHLVKEVKKS